MKIKILLLSIFIVFSLQLSFTNQLFATYNINIDNIENLKAKGYILSDIYTTENSCNENKNIYNQTISYYKRSDCFISNNAYYYIKCDISDDCILNNILNGVNSSGIEYKKEKFNIDSNFNSSYNNLISDYQYYFTPIYLIRTYNNFTEKYYLKTSEKPSNDSVITHNGEIINGKVVLSKLFTNGTKPVYQSISGPDGYITYKNVGNMIGYAWDLPGDGRIAIYNCIKGVDDFFISYDKSCEGYKIYNTEIFYTYPYIENNNSYELTASSYVTLKNDLTIIANTNIPKKFISFCIQGGKCVKLSNKWEDYYIFGINKIAGYKITIKGVPSKTYTGYFKYINQRGGISRSNYFTEVVDNSISGNMKIIGNHIINVSYTIPENIYPKFYINFNGGNYNLIKGSWNILKNNGLNTYSQNISGLIKGIYKSYVVYGNKRLHLNNITIN